jgi:histidinol-phosphatase (PHP family)
MTLPADYHMHTPLCRHATGEPLAYAQHAVALGLTEIGFSDHSPMPQDDFDNWRMFDRQLDEYVAQVQQALGAEVELERLLDVPPVYTDPGEAWMREVFEVMAPHLGEDPTPRTATFFTDAAALSIAPTES